MCGTTWRKKKRSPEFEQLLRYLRLVYGEGEGTVYYGQWLEDNDFNDAIPMVLQKKKILVLSRQMPADRHGLYTQVSEQLGLEIIDSVNHVVAGYAATPIKDCDGDQVTMDAINDAARKYMEDGGVVFAFHRNEPAGIILDEYTAPDGRKYQTHFDKAGWYVVSRPGSNYWNLIEKGALNGYSVGWDYWHYMPGGDGVVDKVSFDDLSYVPYSCNPLCFFGRAKSFRFSDLPSACRCEECSHVVEDPKQHCRDFTCPKCGGRMWRVKSQSSDKDAIKTREGENMKEFAKKWIEEGSWNPRDFDQQGFHKKYKQLTAEERERIPAGQFACTVDGAKKLPIHDAAHTRNAMARYNQAEGCQTPQVKGKICRAARKFDIESAFEKGGFCYTGGKGKMTKEELEAAKAELTKQFPDAEEKIKAVESPDEFDKLKEELEGGETKTAFETFKEELAAAEGDPVKIEEAKKKYWRSEWKAEADRKALEAIQEHEKDKEEHELNKLPAKLDGLEQTVETQAEEIKDLKARMVKMQETTEIKGHGVQPGKGEEPSLLERAMAVDTISDPMALNKLAAEAGKPKEEEK